MGFGSRAARLPIRYWLPLRMDGVCPTLSGLTLRHRPELLSNRLHGPRTSPIAQVVDEDPAGPGTLGYRFGMQCWANLRHGRHTGRERLRLVPGRLRPDWNHDMQANDKVGVTSRISLSRPPPLYRRSSHSLLPHCSLKFRLLDLLQHGHDVAWQ